MRTARCLGVCVAVAIALLGLAPTPARALGPRESQSIDPFELREFTGEQLQQDLRQFRDIVETRHPRLYTDRAAWDLRYESVYESVARGMNELEFYRILAPLVADLNCGHTWLSLPADWDDRSAAKEVFPPLAVAPVDDKLLVVTTMTSPPIPAGAELLSINSIPAPEIISRLEDAIPADGFNLSRKHAIIRNWFATQFATYIQSSTHYVVEYIAPGEQDPASVTLPGVGAEDLSRVESAGPRGEPLRYRFEPGFAVVTIETFNYYSDSELGRFREFTDDFFEEVERRATDTIILDLRRNSGGSPHAAAYLFRHLISEPHPYFARAGTAGYSDILAPQQPAENAFHGDLYVLISGFTFSTTGHFCALLDYHGLALFVGEESGGSYVCTDNSKEILLGNARFRFRFSTAAFEVAVAGLQPGRGTMPDYPVAPSVEDYLIARDAVMEFAITLATGG